MEEEKVLREHACTVGVLAEECTAGGVHPWACTWGGLGTGPGPASNEPRTQQRAGRLSHLGLGAPLVDVDMG